MPAARLLEEARSGTGAELRCPPGFRRLCSRCWRCRRERAPERTEPLRLMGRSRGTSPGIRRLPPDSDEARIQREDLPGPTASESRTLADHSLCDGRGRTWLPPVFRFAANAARGMAGDGFTLMSRSGTRIKELRLTSEGALPLWAHQPSRRQKLSAFGALSGKGDRQGILASGERIQPCYL
ncbi:hypothetical protein BH23GEM6_BH23GEM6_06180 [soil metagenome]